jgi:ABC-type xylose transport system substrate-binding protein
MKILNHPTTNVVEFAICSGNVVRVLAKYIKSQAQFCKRSGAVKKNNEVEFYISFPRHKGDTVNKI